MIPPRVGVEAVASAVDARDVSDFAGCGQLVK
jgi:hypothetical protein